MPGFTKPLNLKTLLDQGLKLPVCPVVFTQLTALLNDQDANTNKLSALISTEPVLTAQLLRMVNSSYYAMKRKITTAQQAIFQLGFGEVASIVSALKAKEMLNELGWSPFNEALWKHSMKTAEIAQALGQWAKGPLSDCFYTAALLHDLGKTILHQVDKNYLSICENGAASGISLVQRERETYGVDHAQLGGELLRHWNLSDSIVKLVAEHHELPNPDDTLCRPRSFFALANEIAHINPLKADWFLLLQERPYSMQLVLGTGLTDLDFELLSAEIQRRIERADRFAD